jgi:hypothetical protein
MSGRDKADKYINPRKRWITIRNPKVYFWGKRIEMIMGLMKKLKKGREIRRHFGSAIPPIKPMTIGKCAPMNRAARGRWIMTG